MLDLFFINDAQPCPLLWAQHAPWLVALSVGMAVLASVLALQMAGLARRADTRFMRQMARGAGAMALGGASGRCTSSACWPSRCARGQFDAWTTVLSQLPSVGAPWVALGLLMRREISRTALVVGGVLVGAGIGAMHYIGMAASQWAPVMRFDPWGFAASLLVAVLLAVGALWVRFGLERVFRWQARWLNLAAGAVMGLAIAAPHYVAMAALCFIDAPGELEFVSTVEGTSLALAMAAVALVIGGLVIAKLEKGAVEREIADFPLQEVCDQILASLRIHAGKKGLALQCVTDDRVPPYLRGDALRLQQVLLNLLGNALKFTERGHVLLRLDYNGGTLVMQVEDTGIGIAAQHLERIFDPFAQADASTTRQFGGTGLGTTLSRQLVERMGGSISVRSTLGVGTTFTVCVPLPVGHATAAVATVSHAVQLPPLRMLVVGDVPANLQVLRHILQADCRLLFATDGERALQVAREQRPDLVLLDSMMPNMDGYAVCRALKADAATASIPVIFITALTDSQDETAGFDVDGVDYLTKPVSPPVVRARVRTHLSLVRMDELGETRLQIVQRLGRAAWRARPSRCRRASWPWPMCSMPSPPAAPARSPGRCRTRWTTSQRRRANTLPPPWWRCLPRWCRNCSRSAHGGRIDA